jgi:hypothetical protein
MGDIIMKFNLFALPISISIILWNSSIAYANTDILEVSSTDIYSEDVIDTTIIHKSWHFYKIEVENPAKLTVKLRKISDNVDLYVSQSPKPSQNNFLCAPLKSGSSIETCRLDSNIPTTWYIGVHGKMNSNYQLKVKTDDLKLLSGY